MKLFWKIGIPVVIAIIIALRMFVGEVCNVPSGSMFPTIITGDWLWIDKVTYGARLPRRFADIPLANGFTWIKPLRIADSKIDWKYRRLRGLRMPHVNDLAVFESPDYPHPLLVKRIVERMDTGDTVTVNVANFETMHKIAVCEKKNIFMRNDSVFINNVPDSMFVLTQSYYYMLGDNWSNSTDSRVYGYIPHSAVVGRMNRVLFSLNKDQQFISRIRWDRFLKKIK